MTVNFTKTETQTIFSKLYKEGYKALEKYDLQDRAALLDCFDSVKNPSLRHGRSDLLHSLRRNSHDKLDIRGKKLFRYLFGGFRLYLDTLQISDCGFDLNTLFDAVHITASTPMNKIIYSFTVKV